MLHLGHDRSPANVVVNVVHDLDCLSGAVEFDYGVNHFNNLVNQNWQIAGNPKVNCHD